MRDAPVHQIETCLHQGLQAFPAELGILRGQDDVLAVGHQCEMRDVTATPDTTGMMDFLVGRNIAKENMVHHAMDAVIFSVSPHPPIVLPIVSTHIAKTQRVFVDVYPSINLL